MDDQENAQLSDKRKPPIATSDDRKSITPDALRGLEKVLAAAPVPPRALTTKDALEKLAPALKKARERGHTADSLVALCATHGLNVSARAIQRAISKIGTIGRAKGVVAA